MDLGLARAGHQHRFFCESDPYRRSILRRHWPGVPVYEDVREVDGTAPTVDLLCGGFPCTDLSVAGRQGGIDGPQSGLWAEYARIIGELRPRFAFVENVPALLRNEWLGRVLGDLAACGYDAEWDCLPASAFGAPHRRDRLWLIAYPKQAGLEEHRAEPRQSSLTEPRDRCALADAEGKPIGAGLRTDATGAERGRRSGDSGGAERTPWATEPDVGRVAYGVPHRVDRVAALGDAAVPQIAEWIGWRLREYDERNRLVPGGNERGQNLQGVEGR